MANTTDKSKKYFPIAGRASDGWSTETGATATCFCGGIQLAFTPPSATNSGLDVRLKLHRLGHAPPVPAGARDGRARAHDERTRYFCGSCGTLLCRVGAVDDFALGDTVLRPRVVQYVEERAGWLDGVRGAVEGEGMAGLG
ncbi:Mss4-like protein [Rostrohypoxylon terebratum]|nr:Mss4-like protein [Rostrohypoxylon terebratum]